MKLGHIFERFEPLTQPLTVFPNIAFDPKQKVVLPVGTPVQLITDFAQQNLVKIATDTDTYFAHDDSYFKATMPISER